MLVPQNHFNNNFFTRNANEIYIYAISNQMNCKKLFFSNVGSLIHTSGLNFDSNLVANRKCPRERVT